MREGDVLRREEFMNPDMICLENRGQRLPLDECWASGSCRVFLHVSDRKVKGWVWVCYLKASTRTQFLCVYIYTTNSEVLNHFPAPPPFCSLYIIEGNPLFITPFFFPLLIEKMKFDQSCTYCKAPLLVNGFFMTQLYDSVIYCGRGNRGDDPCH